MTPIIVSEPGAAVETTIGLILNPTSDGYPAELDLMSGAFSVKSLDVPPPAPKPAYASSYDTEGSVATDEAHYENREITIGMWVRANTVIELEGALNALYNMVGQFNREGGSLEFTTINDTVCYFDLVPEAMATMTVDHLYLLKNAAQVELRLMARPFWRGVEVDLGETAEATLPVLILTEFGPAGDVPALGRLVITDASSNNQWTGIIGGESRYYDPSTASTTSALFYQAEDLTPLGTSTDTAGAAGASGSNVIRNTDLTTTYQAILKSEIDATNAALTHKGTFVVWARLYRPGGNAGAVSVALEWAEGDFLRQTVDNPVNYTADDREGVFTWAKLGVVSISPDSTRWEFRLLAKSTAAGDEIDADCFILFPTEVVYTELSAKQRHQNPTSFSARDEFDQSAGALTGKVAPVGGTWTVVTNSDTDDFAVEASGHTVQRTSAGSDSGTGAEVLVGRGVTAGTTNYTAIATAVDVHTSVLVSGLSDGVLFRVTDSTHYGGAYITWSSTGIGKVRYTRVNGASIDALDLASVPVAANTWYRLIAVVYASGLCAVWFQPRDALFPVFRGARQHVDFATGGTLATGKVGVFDFLPAGTTVTRSMDNFASWVPIPDAATFANQSLTLAHDRATREDSTGSFSSPISSGARGRYLKIPPAGPEGRSTRLVVKGFRNDPYTMPDGGIDDISAQLYVTPRGLVVPEA